MRLHDVPGFEGVLIHEGNTARDTEGCILTGSARAVDEITQSVAAFSRLLSKISAAITRGELVFITLTDPGATP